MLVLVKLKMFPNIEFGKKLSTTGLVGGSALACVLVNEGIGINYVPLPLNIICESDSDYSRPREDCNLETINQLLTICH